METQWKYLDNQFVISTINNYKKAVKLSNYHEAALRIAMVTEPLPVPIHVRYLSVHGTLNTEYDQWKSAGGFHESQSGCLFD